MVRGPIHLLQQAMAEGIVGQPSDAASAPMINGNGSTSAPTSTTGSTTSVNAATTAPGAAARTTARPHTRVVSLRNPWIMPPLPAQYASLLYAGVVGLGAATAAVQHMPVGDRIGTPDDLSDPWAPRTLLTVATSHLHTHLGLLAPVYAILLTAVIAVYTTFFRAHNINALRHAARRIAVNAVVGYITVQYAPELLTALLAATCPASCPPLHAAAIRPIAAALFATVVTREESLVWVRRVLHVRAAARREKLAQEDRVGAAPPVSPVTTPLTTPHHSGSSLPRIDLDDDLWDDKDEWDSVLFWATFFTGFAWTAELCMAAFFLGTAADKVVAVVLGYAGWWLVYVQWYQRPGAPFRPALPGNYHTYPSWDAAAASTAKPKTD
ncbi:hypothetical protein AMAG_15000 [Allomyces macrogynus ATCC 38327]|uniref:Uncharacterized protein n=1 Tax=Allomyces macrogynus (strain ATCC 38327) TaxID=578462 RepID=A0A0L0T8L2_ALLM3|nr:hypothetical protein AMAG_15000 [Allomyces macrogynus ATCC 38327]|eukprot:KNE70904.1 hypothetical protein AMAG_15000 [Allomyces macrogynus ATCC 38327]